MGVETEGDVGRVPPVKKSAGTALQNIIFRIFFLTRITSKTPYLAIDERALGKKRSSVHLFVSVHYAVKYCIFLQGKCLQYVSLLSVMKFVSAVLAY